MNVNENHKGRKVTTLDTNHRRFPVDFPGWGAANAADTLLPIPAGLTGVITSVESHGIAPYTRYCVKFPDGTHTSGLALGTDIKLGA